MSQAGENERKRGVGDEVDSEDEGWRGMLKSIVEKEQVLVRYIAYW